MRSAPPSPSELLSGPDLGGGYLHQLSVDLHDATTTFTHHAQEGGQDAGGPPVGELGVLGFVHPPAPCMFGGPRCWHRRFLLPRSAASLVRSTYQRHRFVLDLMLRQAHGGAPVAFEAALRELVSRLTEPLRAEGIEWYIAGSGSVWLAGGGGAPHDLDVGTSRAGVERIGELLREYLIEPVAPTDGSNGRLVVGGRAFVGSPKAGSRVEWAVPLEPRAPLPLEELVGAPGVSRTVEVPFGDGPRIRISRPEYALLRAAERDRPVAVEAAIRAIESLGADGELLEVLLARSSLPEGARLDLRERFRR
ncbi:MAG TPA: hypothetical protein VEG42_03090 [Thermoplasmata archaeon]|nr:hypothetical protein [Thermoplasmata archaeon]